MSTTLNPIPVPGTQPEAPVAQTPSLSGRDRRPNHRVALIVGAAAIVVAGAAVAVGVAVSHTNMTGSSTVPAAAASWTDSYGVGSTVYAEQVPTAPAPWTDAYAKGSTIYREQVPEG